MDGSHLPPGVRGEGSAPDAPDRPPDHCDVVVVGGGILGLAVARELLIRRPGLTVTVLEREARIAAHQSGHNSGVIHAGIYYEPGSLKAQLCVEGRRLMFDFCAEQGIPAERAGKLVIARDAGELERLGELHRRGTANGVDGLRRLRAEEIAEIEPHAVGVGALHSPETGIVDFARVARALADDIRRRGQRVVAGCGVEDVDSRSGRAVVRHAYGTTTARHVIGCAGAWSDRLAERSGAPKDPRIVPFRGAYLLLRPERRSLVRNLIYPVPDPALPFLGVHLTRHVDGSVSVGPTALMVGARDAYRAGRIRPADAWSTASWPGSWRLAWRFRRTAVEQLHRAVDRRVIVRDAAAFLPELSAEDVLPGPAGIRAQALDRQGRLVEDFVFSETPLGTHLRNAPSPAATSSLAIARRVVDRVIARLEPA